MSLSQKHSGKILVPWFNSAEWKYVSSLLVSGNNQQLQEALNVLKTWKIRTPLLASGIEGTLIIVEAILSNNGNVSEEDMRKIYSLSLMRFLNVCAANSDRQGSFNKQINESDLPKWLINIRHDIAHGNTMPAKSILETGINVCLQWLIKTYWIKETANITDYVIDEPSGDIVETFKLYMNLKMKVYNKFKAADFADAFISNVCLYIPKKLHKNGLDIPKILDYWEVKLTNQLLPKHVGFISKLVAETLVFTPALRQEGLDKNFKELWHILFNILHQKSMIFNVLNHLCDVASDDSCIKSSRKMASLWIQLIFRSLIRSQKWFLEKQSMAVKNEKMFDKQFKQKYPEFIDSLPLDFCSTGKEGIKFQEKILQNPNQYTGIYLEMVLRYNHASEMKIKQLLQIVEKFTQCSTSLSDRKLFSIADLPQLANKMETDDDLVIENPDSIGPKWKLITNNEDFVGLPLGILPGQSHHQNPVLSIN